MKKIENIKKRAITALPLIGTVIILYYSPPLLFAIFLGVIAAIGIWEIKEMNKNGKKYHRKSDLLSVLFAIYLCLSLILYYFLKFGNNGKFYFILIITVVGTFDATAYLIGKGFGKHRITPKISPRKTVEGTIGGSVFSIIAIIVVWIITEPIFDGDFWNTFLTGIIIPPLAFLGDLLESFYKRKMGVKDSGKILPGHGGLLDRIDSLLLPIWGFLLLKVLSLIS